ncbi:MAG: hypothetical protein GX131_09585 [candidate division WS1 bacterium]|jgi:intracellular septation protein A|nr:hypothetical protein [candidate division WS1 bacterium]
MISPADVLCIALAVGMVALEGSRGVIPALVDFAAILLGVTLIGWGYIPLSDQMQPSTACGLLLLGVVLATAFLSIFISHRLKVHVTAIESAVGAVLGLLTATFLSYAFIKWLTIRYGLGALIVKNSILYWAIVESAGLRELAQFMRTLMGR